LAEGKLDETKLVSALRRDFLGRYPKCFEPEEPNIAGIAWGRNSTRLLVAAEVLPHANCDNMGTFVLYEVAVPNGKIMHRWSQLAAKKSFRELLGPELQNANDQCFFRPRDCEIPALHRRK
jgi:hypothetical protein